MRLITLSLAALLLLIQYPLWLGKGGWLRVWDLDDQVSEARKKNDELRARNALLESEVRNLREGTEAIEERARYELGMIREGEIFIQLVEPNSRPPASPPLQLVAPANAGSRSAAISEQPAHRR